MPINGTAPGSPDLSRGQSALSAPREKNAHLLGEQKVELWLKPLCLQQQLFNPFVWCMKSVPRTQRLLITVFPVSRSIGRSLWFLPSGCFYHLELRSGRLLETHIVFYMTWELLSAPSPAHPNKPNPPGGLAHCLSSLAGSACWRLCFC